MKNACLKLALPILLLCVVAGVFLYTPQALPAEAAEDYGIYDETGTIPGIGYDLDGYYVSFSYHNYTLRNSGVYFAFVITLDKDFHHKISLSDNNVIYDCALLKQIEILFKVMGYTVVCDDFNGQLYAYLSYDTMTDYYIANGLDGYETSDSDATEDKGFLFTDYYTESKTVFSLIGSGDNVIDACLELFKEAGAPEDKIALRYVYGTPYKIVTSDADSVTYNTQRNLYLHSFNLTIADKDRVIHLKQHAPNSVGWYVLAVIIAIPAIAVPLTIMILKRKKKQEGIN